MKQSKIIGLIGNSGSGKSLAADILKERGAAVINADQITRRILALNGAAYSEAAELFGSGVINTDGTLNRAKIADIVFSDNEMLKKHKEITYKHMKQEILNELDAYIKERKAIIVIDCAVLIDYGFHMLCDSIWLITAPYETKINRIMSRDNLTEEAAKKRLAAQLPDEEAKKYADIIIENNTGPDEIKERVNSAIASQIKKRINT